MCDLSPGNRQCKLVRYLHMVVVGHTCLLVGVHTCLSVYTHLPLNVRTHLSVGLCTLLPVKACTCLLVSVCIELWEFAFYTKVSLLLTQRDPSGSLPIPSCFNLLLPLASPTTPPPRLGVPWGNTALDCTHPPCPGPDPSSPFSEVYWGRGPALFGKVG